MRYPKRCFSFPHPSVDNFLSNSSQSVLCCLLNMVTMFSINFQSTLLSYNRFICVAKSFIFTFSFYNLRQAMSNQSRRSNCWLLYLKISLQRRSKFWWMIASIDSNLIDIFSSKLFRSASNLPKLRLKLPSLVPSKRESSSFLAQTTLSMLQFSLAVSRVYRTSNLAEMEAYCKFYCSQRYCIFLRFRSRPSLAVACQMLNLSAVAQRSKSTVLLSLIVSYSLGVGRERFWQALMMFRMRISQEAVESSISFTFRPTASIYRYMQAFEEKTNSSTSRSTYFTTLSLITSSCASTLVFNSPTSSSSCASLERCSLARNQYLTVRSLWKEAVCCASSFLFFSNLSNQYSHQLRTRDTFSYVFCLSCASYRVCNCNCFS